MIIGNIHKYPKTFVWKIILHNYILYSLLNNVMSRDQWHIGVQKHHLVFKVLIQLSYNVLVFTHFYAMSVCIMTRTIPLASNKGDLSDIIFQINACMLQYIISVWSSLLRPNHKFLISKKKSEFPEFHAGCCESNKLVVNVSI